MLFTCVCLSVRLSITSRHSIKEWLNVVSCKQRHTIAQGLYFSDAKDLGKILTRSPPTVGAKQRWSRFKQRFYQYLAICQKERVQNKDNGK